MTTENALGLTANYVRFQKYLDAFTMTLQSKVGLVPSLMNFNCLHKIEPH